VRVKSEKIFHDLRRRVAFNLARLRADRGLTFEQLGTRSGLHWRHLQKIEAGESNVQLLTIARLASGLCIDVGDLVVRISRG
jgi:XRE family transcriptional regulator, regulator of sulfur utilization